MTPKTAQSVDARSLPRGETVAAAGQRALVVAPRAPAHYAEPPPVLSTTPNIPGLLQALRRRWRLVTFLGLIVASGAAAVTWYTQAERFIVRTQIHISASRPFLINEIHEGRTDFSTYQRSQMAYVKSRLVLSAALLEPKIAQLSVVREQVDPLVWLEREVHVDFSVAPEMMRIYMSGEQPQDLVAIVNAVREIYLKEAIRQEAEGRTKRLGKLAEIFAEEDQKLQQKRRLLSQMAEDLGSTKDVKVMEKTQELYWKTVENLQSDLLQTRSKLNKSKMELDLLLKRDPKTGEVKLSPRDIEVYLGKDIQIQGCKKEIGDLVQEIDYMKKTMVKPDAELAYKRAVAALNAKNKELESRREQLSGKLTGSLRDSSGTLHNTLRDDIAVLEQQEKWLSDAVEAQVKSFKGITQKRIELEWLRDEIALAEDLAKTLAHKRQTLQIEMQAPDRFKVMEDAASVPDKDARIKKAGYAGGAAFALVAALIGFFEFRTRRVSNVDEIVRGLNLRLMGALPMVPRSAHRSSDGSRPGKEALWQEHLNESVESTRTMLLHAAQTEGVRLIAVTSAVSGEGKTLTCSHLATSLARAGRNTLLIDADLRRPTLHRVFTLENQVGFSEVLRGEAGAATAIQHTPVPCLSIMTAGASDDRAIQALSQPVFDNVFQSLKEQFDFIIVDTPPVLLVADSQLISQRCDGVVFSILQNVSRLPQIYAAHERLSDLKIRVLGAVVNGAVRPFVGAASAYGRGA